MFTDVVTVFTHGGEDAQGRARYAKTVVKGALVRVSDGVKQYPARNLESEDRVRIYFRIGAREGGPRFVPEDRLGAMEATGEAFTVRTDGRDRISLGEAEGDSPPAGAYRPVSVMINEKGSKRIWHAKVVCR